MSTTRSYYNYLYWLEYDPSIIAPTICNSYTWGNPTPTLISECSVDSDCQPFSSEVGFRDYSCINLINKQDDFENINLCLIGWTPCEYNDFLDESLQKASDFYVIDPTLCLDSALQMVTGLTLISSIVILNFF